MILLGPDYILSSSDVNHFGGLCRNGCDLVMSVSSSQVRWWGGVGGVEDAVI